MAEAQAFPQKKARCLSCAFETDDEEKLLSHVRIHQHASNPKIMCFRCNLVLGSIDSYKRHRKICKDGRFENDVLEEPVQQELIDWECEICHEILKLNRVQSIEDFNIVKDHLSIHSNAGLNLAVRCPFQTNTGAFCLSIYQKYKSLNRHLNRHKRKEEFKVKNEDVPIQALDDVPIQVLDNVVQLENPFEELNGTGEDSNTIADVMESPASESDQELTVCFILLQPAPAKFPIFILNVQKSKVRYVGNVMFGILLLITNLS